MNAVCQERRQKFRLHKNGSITNIAFILNTSSYTQPNFFQGSVGVKHGIFLHIVIIISHSYFLIDSTGIHKKRYGILPSQDASLNLLPIINAAEYHLALYPAVIFKGSDGSGV